MTEQIETPTSRRLAAEVAERYNIAAGVILRRYDAAMEVDGDGRTIVGRCVPYDVVADVSDDGLSVYREVVRHGAFRRVVRDPGRTALTFETHTPSLIDEIGRAVALEERSDGLYATFRAHDSTIGAHGLAILRDGFVTGLSIGAVLHPSGSRLVDGVVERRLFAQLTHVTATSDPAYPGAEVVAMRSGEPSPEGIRETLAKQKALRERSFS